MMCMLFRPIRQHFDQSNNIVNNHFGEWQSAARYRLDQLLGDNGFDEFYTTVTVTNGFLRVVCRCGVGQSGAGVHRHQRAGNTPRALSAAIFNMPARKNCKCSSVRRKRASLSASDLLGEPNDGPNHRSREHSVSYNSTTNTATFTFPGFAGGMLPVGTYKMSVTAGSIASSAGFPLTNGFSIVVLQLLGDWSLDNQQSVADITAALGAMAELNGYETAHSLSAAQLLALGDVNGDGHVDNADLQGAAGFAQPCFRQRSSYIGYSRHFGR